MQLQARNVLITGGRRLGAHLAEALAQRGANIALSYFTSGEAAKVSATRCRAMGVQALTYQADLRKSDACDQLVQYTVDCLGSLDVLVNLTSVYHRTPFDTLTPADYEASLAANLSAPYFTAVAAARIMRQQPRKNGLQGKMIHFTDWSIGRPHRDFLPYLVAKGGLETLTRALAVELAPTITVNAIAPGTILPPPATSEAQRNAIRESSALERDASPDDITNLVLYLLEGTDFVTGEIFRIDGGRFLGNPQAVIGDLGEEA